MLCAAWEIYNEDVLLECVDFLNDNTDDAHGLPDRIKGKICQAAKGDQHDFGVLNLSGNGWKKVYRDQASKICGNLNTPKFGQLSEIFHDWLAVKPAELEATWRHPKEELNRFVSLRGEIAHRGGDAQYVPIGELKLLKEKIDDLVVDTDRFLCKKMRDLVGTQPWRNTK